MTALSNLHPFARQCLCLGLFVFVLPGCAAFRSYNAELTKTINLAASGNPGQAAAALEKSHSRNRDLLYYLELGELQRLDGRFEDSQKAWLAADRQVQAWEEAARVNPAKLLGGGASLVVNDKVSAYEGHDYEKVMLTTRMALNHLALDDWDTARVDIKRTHERETVIENLRAKEIEKTEEEAKKRGAKTGFKELNGYPVQSIDNPEVNALRNSYQSAFSHYLSGFVYEALGEPSLAAAGYRQAIELHPDNPTLEEALSGLDARIGDKDDGKTDVLFVIESGTAPARVSQQFSLPIPYNNQLLFVSVSFPVMRQEDFGSMPSAIHMGGSTATPTVVTSIDAMARRSLQEEMPGIMLRGIIRSTAKAVTQYQVAKQDDTGLAGLAIAIGSIVTESADERAWRMLPAQIAVARARVPAGTPYLEADTPSGTQRIALAAKGRYQVIALRMLRGRLFVMPPPGPVGDKPEHQASTPPPPQAFLAATR
ncbi:MAG TPA: hypothetical protein VF460_03365 [Burkholderiales bacterium]